MKLQSLHPWGVTAREAVNIQRRLAPMVSAVSSIPKKVALVAGVDVSPPGPDGVVRAAAVVLSFPDMSLEEVGVAEGKPGFPYVPGLLSFRETPVAGRVLESLALTPDLIIADAHGTAHPRRFGLACHLGLLADVPTIGCAKSRLTGTHDALAGEVGSRVELVSRGEVIGMVVRTRADVSPVYVSVGHKIDPSSAVDWVLACSRGKRLPETTRLAHQAAAGSIAPGRRGLPRSVNAS